MTENRSADRLILDWLATEPGAMDAERVDASLAAARALRQRRGLRAVLIGSGSWPARPALRLSRLSPGLRIALVLAAATAIVAGGLLAAGALLRQPQDLPRAIHDVRGAWLAREPDGMSFGFGSGPPSVLTLNLPLDSPRASVSHLQIPNQLLTSNFALMNDQILSFTTVGTDGGGVFVGGTLLETCTQGDLGRYRWSLAGGGGELTLTAESEACDSRRAVFERTWLRAFEGDSRGGTAIVPRFTDMFSLTLPEGEYKTTRLHDGFVARGTLGDGQPFTVFVLRRPRDERGTDCQEPWTPGDEIAPGRDNIWALAQRRPILVGAMPDQRDDRLIDGLTAMHLSYRRGCVDGSTVLWGVGDADGYRIGQPEGQDASLWFVERGGALWAFGTLGPDLSDSDFEKGVLDSIHWIDRPTDGEVPS